MHAGGAPAGIGPAVGKPLTQRCCCLAPVTSVRRSVAARSARALG